MTNRELFQAIATAAQPTPKPIVPAARPARMSVREYLSLAPSQQVEPNGARS
jgi:hypothetical protein